MRTWGPSGAAAAIRRAQAVSRLARRTGSGVDEAADWLDRPMTRRGFLGTAGAGVLAGAATRLPHRPAAAPGDHGDRGDRSDKSAPRVVIVGSGIAGLGCAYRLWAEHGIRSDIYEFNTVPGGRIRTLRGYFEDGQVVEEHAEFINPEHTFTLSLARSFGLTFDDADKYPPGTHPGRQTMRFNGKMWRQSALDHDWHEWGWKLFHDAAFVTAPWPQLWNHNNPGGRRFDRMSVTEWLDAYVPGGATSDFGAVCIATILDEYGGPAEQTSALNLVYLLGQDASVRSGAQPHTAPELAGADEKWHIHGGNDQLITGLLDRLPGGALHLGERLVAIRPGAAGGYRCSFQSGSTTRDVSTDHVVLALPSTLLRSVDLSRVPIAPLHIQAIDAEPLGSNSKMFLQFSSRVWDEEGMDGNCFDDGVVQGGWDATGYQRGKQGILAALPGGENGLGWGQLYGLSGYTGQPPEKMIKAYLDGFDALFPRTSRAFNGRSYYVWSPGDPHLLGAYSYLAVGQFTQFNGIQSQQEGNLHFGGEQTSQNFQGYIEGALRSGYRCANEVTA